MQPQPVNQSHGAISAGKSGVRVYRKNKGNPSLGSAQLEKHKDKATHQRPADAEAGMITLMQQANTAAKVAVQSHHGTANRVRTANPSAHQQPPAAMTSSATGLAAKQPPPASGLNPRQQYQHAKKALTMQQQITLD